MSRRHFKKLAEALKESSASAEICQAIAGVCRSENPRFDTYKFLEACGVA